MIPNLYCTVPRNDGNIRTTPALMLRAIDKKRLEKTTVKVVFIFDYVELITSTAIEQTVKNAIKESLYMAFSSLLTDPFPRSTKHINCPISYAIF